MLRMKIIAGLLLCVLAFPVGAQELGNEINNTGEVLLPNEGYSKEFDLLKAKAHQRNATSKRWRTFKETYGEWYATWNVFNPTPDRLWGEGFQLPDYQTITDENAEDAARAALREFSSILFMDETQLERTGIVGRDGKHTVLFQQVRDGIPVLFSTVFVKMGDNGRVFMLGCDYQPFMTVNTTPSLSEEQAQVSAFSGLRTYEDYAADNALEENNIFVEGGDLAILPTEGLDGLAYHLVYHFVLHIDDMRIWDTYVDAHSGEIIWRKNKVRTGSDGIVTASVRKNNVLSNPDTVNISGMYVKVNGQNVVTDSLGKYTSANSGTVTFGFQGPYIYLTNGSGSDAVASGTVANNGTYNLYWNDNNSTSAERNAFAHVMRSRAFLKSIDPSFTGMDYQVSVVVNSTNSVCNAWWDGSGFTFLQRGIVNGQQCANTAEMIEVVAHEYGHGINEKLYNAMGQMIGMVNSSLNEGLADGNACLLLDTPDMGVGFFTNAPLRDLDNTNKYPDDVENDSHVTGLIIGGAVWDMREAVGLALTTNLVHFAKYDVPNDVDNGTCFTEYLLAILAEDDNDNNLANGTPHSASIIPAFWKHGIPGPLFSVIHDPIEGVAANTAIPISATVNVDFTGLVTSAVTLYYRVHGGSWTAVSMNGQSGVMPWNGSIPAQIGGAVVDYYFKIDEALFGSMYYPADGANGPFVFPVNFETQTFYDFETSQGWVGGIAGDNAVTGIWERGNPNPSQRHGEYVQPDEDHTPTGVNCWFTGQSLRSELNSPGVNDVDDGTTTLVSPLFSVQNLNSPAIRYWRWYTNDFGDNPNADNWVVQISSDGGSSWTNIENTTESLNEWSMRFFLIGEHVTPSSTMRLRFIASDLNGGSLVEAALDDVEIMYVNPIPVELSSLSANRYDNLVVVDWGTESETNNYGFDVEYQLSGSETWVNAGFVEGRGTNSGYQPYQYSFSEYTGETIHVRLKQMDFDGSYRYSPVVEVSGRGFSFVLHQNYPNPFNPSTRIQFELPEAYATQLALINSYGQVVRSIDMGTLSAGIHDVQVDMDGLPSGLYIYRLQAGGRTMSRSMHLVR